MKKADKKVIGIGVPIMSSEQVVDKKVREYLERGQKIFDNKREMSKHDMYGYEPEAIEIAKMIQEEENK